MTAGQSTEPETPELPAIFSPRRAKDSSESPGTVQAGTPEPASSAKKTAPPGSPGPRNSAAGKFGSTTAPQQGRTINFPQPGPDTVPAGTPATGAVPAVAGPRPATVTVVFVATNETEVLIRALESLDANPPRHPLQIVVIDNASTVGVAGALAGRWPGITVLRQAWCLGLPANLNRGIRATSAPYVLLCNPDLSFHAGAVDALADFLHQHPRAGMAAPLLLSEGGDPHPSARRWYTLESLLALKVPWTPGDPPVAVARSVYAEWDQREARRVDWVPCPATLVRRSALAEVGGMDERFRLYFDDVDISLRMHLGGWEVWCVPEAKVVHFEQRASVKAFSKPWRWHLTSLAKFAIKHRGLGPPGAPRT